MSVMPNLISLPNEIIEKILNYSIFTIEDIKRLSVTCQRLHFICKSNTLWRKKFFEMWPRLRYIYMDCIDKDHNFQHLTSYRIEYRQIVSRLLSEMSELHYDKEDLTIKNMAIFDPLFYPKNNMHVASYHFLVDELTNIIKHSIRQENLTNKFYAVKIMRYVRCNFFEYQWHLFINQEQKFQIFEKVAVFVAQYCQPLKFIHYSNISLMLDELAQLTLNRIKQQFPQHSIFTKTDKEFTRWKTECTLINYFDTTESRCILDALCKLMYDELQFRPNISNTSEKYLYIDYVLKNRCGAPIILGIILAGIARRLGVCCILEFHSTNTFAYWLRVETVNNYEIVTYCCINISNGIIQNEYTFIEYIHERFANVEYDANIEHAIQSTYSIAIATYLIESVKLAISKRYGGVNMSHHIRSVLEFKLMINPNNLFAIIELSTYYKSRNMDLTDIIAMLHKINTPCRKIINRKNKLLKSFNIYRNHQTSFYNNKSKFRITNVKYTIGMIVSYKRYERSLKGVIIGWNSQYLPKTTASQQLILYDCEMNNIKLNQPFYNVLSENDRKYYIPEEMLKVASPTLIKHHEIGRYFHKFVKTHYEPNECLRRNYPEDEKIRNKWLSRGRYINQ